MSNAIASVASKWNRWKLIHKETGLTFNQFYKLHSVKEKDGTLYHWGIYIS